MKTNSLKCRMITIVAASHHMTLDKYVQYNPRVLRYNPGSEAMFSKGNSGVRKAQRAAKSRRNVRARSSKH